MSSTLSLTIPCIPSLGLSRGGAGHGFWPPGRERHRGPSGDDAFVGPPRPRLLVGQRRASQGAAADAGVGGVRGNGEQDERTSCARLAGGWRRTSIWPGIPPHVAGQSRDAEPSWNDEGSVQNSKRADPSPTHPLRAAPSPVRGGLPTHWSRSWPAWSARSSSTGCSRASGTPSWPRPQRQRPRQQRRRRRRPRERFRCFHGGDGTGLVVHAGGRICARERVCVSITLDPVRDSLWAATHTHTRRRRRSRSGSRRSTLSPSGWPAWGPTATRFCSASR